VTNAESFVKQLTETLQDHIDADALHKVQAAVESLYFAEIPPCLAKADVNEPVFVLRGQDETAEGMVAAWLLNNPQAPPAKRNAAKAVMVAMDKWPHQKRAD
jgi:hypothetical protein